MDPVAQRIIEAVFMTFFAAAVAYWFARPKDRATIRSLNANANRDNAEAVALTSEQLVEALKRVEKYEERIDELEKANAEKTKQISSLQEAGKRDHAEIRILRIQQRENMAEIVGLRNTVGDLRTGVRILTTQIVDELHAQPKWSPTRVGDREKQGEDNE